MTLASQLFAEHTPGTWFFPLPDVLVTDMRTLGHFLWEMSSDRTLAHEVKLCELDIEYWWGYPSGSFYTSHDGRRKKEEYLLW